MTVYAPGSAVERTFDTEEPRIGTVEGWRRTDNGIVYTVSFYDEDTGDLRCQEIHERGLKEA